MRTHQGEPGSGQRYDAAFLDRDGTLIEDPGYLSDPRSVSLLPGAAEAVKMLNEQGIPVLVVTNQSGIGRGYYCEEDFREVQIEVERQLAAHGARIDRTYHCPHDPRTTSCQCRKPGQELFRRAAQDFDLRLERCLFIGDRARDVEPGVALGGEAILVAGADGRYDQPVSAEVARAASLKDAILAAVPRSES